MMNKGSLFIVTGPSGAGKGAVLGGLQRTMENVFYSISATTRQPRPGEVDGVNYYFLSHERFKEMIANGEELPKTATEEPTATGTFWDEIEYLDREEFRCQCKGKYCNGFPVEPQEKMVRTVDEIRRRLGVPVTIVESGGSGVRCPIHNANVGGDSNSNHLTGNAADLHSSKSPQEMARVAEEVMGNTGEIGIYSWGIHVGVNCKYSRFYG